MIRLYRYIRDLVCLCILIGYIKHVFYNMESIELMRKQVDAYGKFVRDVTDILRGKE